MSLSPNKTIRTVYDKFSIPSEFGVGIRSVSEELDVWQHPKLQLTLVLERRLSIVRDSDGAEVQRVVEKWFYDQPTQYPVHELHETSVFTWVPGVNHRTSLILAQRDWKTYWYENGIVGNKPSWRTTREGYVVYDLTGQPYEPIDVEKVLKGEGKLVPQGPRRIIADSARVLAPAIAASAVVKQQDANQHAIWQRISLEEQIVRDDFQRWIITNLKFDYLTGLSDVQTVIELKEPLTIELPIELPAPDLKASDAQAAGVRLEVRGGDGELKSVWPEETVQLIRVESYAIFRRTVTQPARTFDGDPYGLYEEGETPPAVVVRLPLEHTDVTDLDGDPASPLPPPVGYTEAEDNDIPDAEGSWDLVAEVENEETLRGMPGRALVMDEGVEQGGVYEYYAVARVGQTESPESNHETVTYNGSRTFQSSLRVLTRGTEVDVLAPPRDGLDETYGEAMIIEVPADALETDLGQLGRDFGLRHLTQEQPGLECTLTPSFPVLFMERGQQCTVPQAAWETWGNSLHLSTQLAAKKWRVEGFELSARRQGERLEVSPGRIELTEIL